MVALFVVFMIVAFLAVDLVLTARRQSVAPRELVAGFQLAADRSYHAGHTWALQHGRSRARVGIDHFAAHIVGAPDTVGLPAVGDRVHAGKPLATVLRKGRRSVIAAPMTGRVASVNRQLERRPNLLWAEPFDGGWLAEIEPDDIALDMRALQSGGRARAWLDASVARLHQMLSPVGALPAAADGGLAVEAISDVVDEEHYQRITSQLLLSDGD